MVWICPLYSVSGGPQEEASFNRPSEHNESGASFRPGRYLRLSISSAVQSGQFGDLIQSLIDIRDGGPTLPTGLVAAAE